ncbi:MAG: DUF4860 domain-containing protein [Lachnospiraceae bacterium]|jgi:hypothetical protein|nr:DUF4860 domain-containing protein [Lachnospiraceae bacterium]
MNDVKNRHNMDSVFVLLLFAVFAGCILLVLLFGASSYESLVRRDNQAYNSRTAISYIAAKVRHSDERNSIFIGSFADRTDSSKDDISTLYLKFPTDEGTYFTKIYYYDGYIREVLCADDSGLSPEDGNEILKAKGISFLQEGNLVTVRIQNSDNSMNYLSLCPRCKQEVTQNGE